MKIGVETGRMTMVLSMFCLIAAMIVTIVVLQNMIDGVASRRTALLVCSSHFRTIPGNDAPAADGVYTYSTVAGATEYSIETSVTTLENERRKIRVTVTDQSGNSLMAEGSYYSRETGNCAVLNYNGTGGWNDE